MMKGIQLFLYLFFVLIQPGCVTGQDYYVQHFTTENGLPQNSIKGIELDKNGYLWLATETGIARYDGNQFKTFNHQNTAAISSVRAGLMGMLNDGNVFVLMDGGNYLRVTDSNQILPFKPETAVARTMELLNKPGSVLKRCNLKIERKEQPAWIAPDPQAISRSVVNSMAITGGRYMYFNTSRELVVADTLLTRFSRPRIYFDQPTPPDLIKNGKAISILSDKGNLFLRVDDFIYSMMLSGDEKTISLKTSIKIGGIPNISFLKQVPGTGISFIGTMADGLYVFKKQDFSVRLFNDHEANIMYALERIGRNDVVTKKGILGADAAHTLQGFNSETLLRTCDGQYYFNRNVSPEKSGIAVLDSNLKETRFIPVYNLQATCFREFDDRSVWLAADFQFLGRVLGDSVHWISRPAGIPKDFHISTFIKKKSGEIWIGGSSGLFVLDSTGTNTIRKIEGPSNVRFLYEDRKGIIWAGTYGFGFFACEGSNAVAMPTDRSGYLSMVHCMLEDNAGRVWITTNRGLFLTSMKSLYNFLEKKNPWVYYQYFDKSEGFRTNEFNGGCNPSGVRLGDGSLAFPSIMGICNFHPDSVTILQPGAGIFIDAVLADSNRLQILNDQLTIDEKVHRLQFEISSPYFGNSYNNNIEYKIDGLTEVWYPLNRNGIIEVGKLPSGRYKLLLRKKSGFAEAVYKTREVKFTVKPAWYESWIFYLLLAKILVVAIVFTTRWRLRMLVKQKQNLEIEVKERTREQEMLIESLEQTVKELEDSKDEIMQHGKFMENLAMILAHDLQSPLRFFSDEVDRLEVQSREDEGTQVNQISRELKKTSLNVYRFVEDFGSWLGATGKNFKPQLRPANVYRLMTELKEFSNSLLHARANKLEMDIDPDLRIITDRHLLKIILRNLIDNANKNSWNSVIRVRVAVSNGTATISVKDKGNGMPTAVIERINARQSANVNPYEFDWEEKGHGYKFILFFCSLLGVKIIIDSSIGMGSEVALEKFQVADANSSQLDSSL